MVYIPIPNSNVRVQVDSRHVELALKYKLALRRFKDKKNYFIVMAGGIPLVHRLFGKPLDGCCHDHIESDALDNRSINIRQNLPIVINSMMKQGTAKDSIFRGVRRAGRTTWASYIRDAPGGRKRQIGTFATESLAAEAYNVALRAKLEGMGMAQYYSIVANVI